MSDVLSAPEVRTQIDLDKDVAFLDMVTRMRSRLKLLTDQGLILFLESEEEFENGPASFNHFDVAFKRAHGVPENFSAETIETFRELRVSVKRSHGAGLHVDLSPASFQPSRGEIEILRNSFDIAGVKVFSTEASEIRAQRYMMHTDEYGAYVDRIEKFIRAVEERRAGGMQQRPA